MSDPEVNGAELWAHSQQAPAKVDDGGPAFPSSNGMRVGDVSISNADGGMSMRDYFAAKALGLIGSMAALGMHTVPRFGLTAEGTIAQDAYRLADAMLKVRQE